MCVVNDAIQFCTVKPYLDGSNIFVLSIYKLHAETITNFTETMVTMLSHNRLRNTVCVVIGDVNINLLKNSSEIVNFKSAMFSFHYLRLISKPKFFSRKAAYQPSCLDRICNNKTSHFDCGIVEHNLKEDCPVFVRLPVRHVAESGNMRKLRDKPCAVDWSDIESKDVSDYLEGFTSKLNCLYCECFTLRTKLISRKNSITHG